MEFVILNNIKEFNLLKEKGFNFKNKSIVTTNIDIIQGLKNDYEIINLWMYLDDGIINNSEKTTIDILNKFKLPVEFGINYYSVNVIEITKIYLRNFIKGVLHTEFALKKLNNSVKPSVVWINKNKNKYLAGYYDQSNILDGTCEYFYRNSGYNIKQFDIISENEASDKKYNFDTSEYALNLEKLIKNNRNGRILILLSENFEWDFDLTKYLQKKYDNVFPILRTPSRNSEKENIDYTPVFFDDFKFNCNARDYYLKKVDKSEKYFSKNSSKLVSDYPVIFNNPYVKFQFKDFFNKQRNYINDLVTFDNVFSFIKPGKIFFSNSWDMSVRCMVKRAMELGSETFVTIHGGVVDNAGYHSRTIDTDNYLVWGKDNYNGLIKYGQKESSIKIVGSVQMDFWNDRVNELKANGEIKIKSEYDNIYNFKIKKKNRSDKPVITFFTSDGGGFSSQGTNEYKHISSLENIIKLAKDEDKFEFRIKPHVLYDYFEYWEKVKKNFPDNLKLIKENNLMEACEELDLGILLNTISNVAYEISISGKPVIFLKEAVFNAPCSESTIERSGLLCIDSFNQFKEFICEYLTDDNIKENLEFRRKKFLEFALADFSEPTMRRIESLLIKEKQNILKDVKFDLNIYYIIKWVADSVKSEKSLKFPENIITYTLPGGEDILNWIYRLTETWCLYFNKSQKTSVFFENILKKIPASIGLSESLKFKKNIYAKTRKIYLNYNLNNNKLTQAFKKRFKIY